MFSNARVLKPFDNFENTFQDLSPVTFPIAFPGTLDDFAGKEGYDPNLLAGIPVPMGSKVMLWLPRLSRPLYGQVTPDYNYQLVWRVRSLTEQNLDPARQRVGHFGQRLQGVAQIAAAEASVDSAGPRFIIPAAVETVQVVNSEQLIEDPRNATDSLVVQKGIPEGTISPEPATVDVNSARFNTKGVGSTYNAPPSQNFPGPESQQKLGASGLLSQGYYSDGNGTASGSDNNAAYSAGPQFNILETTAKGDELLILLSRSITDGIWNFSGNDRGLSDMLGTAAGSRGIIPGLGIYVFTGSTT